MTKNWKKLSQRGLSLLVCLIMCLGMLPGVAYAEENPTACGKCGSIDIAPAHGNSGHYECNKCHAIYKPNSGWDGGCSHINIEIRGAEAATCTEKGYTGDRYCTECGAITSAGTIIEALDHSYSYTDNKDGTHNAVCANDESHTIPDESCSYEDGKCTKCGTAEPVLCDHTAATCKDGNTCPDCKSTIEAKPHTWDGGEVTKKPTCTEKGVMTFTCTISGCNETKTEDVEATDHDLSIIHPKYVPLCRCETTGGESHVECKICGKLFLDKTATEEVTAEDMIIPAIGHTLVYKEATEPTCTKAGNIAHYVCSCTKCSSCKYKYFSDSAGTEVLSNVIIPAKGHDMTEISAKAATCTENGNKQYWRCNECKGMFIQKNDVWQQTKSVIIYANGHKYETPVWKWNGTETSATATFTCANDASHVATVDATMSHVVIKEATCVAGGEITYTATASIQNKPTSKPEVYTDTRSHSIPAIGDHQWDEGNVTTEPSCKPGVKTLVCITPGCGATKTEVIPATGIHVSGEPVVTPATCEARGTKVTSCKNCSYVFVTEVLPALDHDYKVTGTTPATCTKQGEIKYTCQRAGCEASYTEGLPLVPHTLTVHAKEEPTCTENGMEAHSTCSVCNGFFTGAGTSLEETAEDDLVILATNHTYVAVVTAPTCTEGGYITHTCTKCGDSYTDTQTNAVGHAYGAWTITAAPTMSAPGEARRICTNDESHVETAELPQLPAPGTPDSVWTLDTGRSTAPTCTESGENVYVSVYGEASVNVPALDHSFPAAWTYDGANHWHACTRCGAAGGAAAHAYDGGVVTLAPTAYTAGVRTYTCTACGRYYTEAIPATGTTGPVSPVFPAPDPGTSGGGGAANPSAPTETILDEDTPLAGITFDDVMPTDPFYEAVQYVFNRKLMNGVSDTSFDPYGTLTRAMVVTILYRLDGEPAAEPSAFLDVAAGQWYTDAVGWGAANKVVKGYSEDRFGPMDPVTREQLAAILHRYAQYKGYDVTEIADLAAYADMASISEYALEAMAWAVALGAPEALSETALVPRDNATRVQVAVAFMNFCEKYIPLETEGEAA